MDIDVERLMPLKGKLLGKLNKEPQETEGGVYLPDSVRRTKHEVTIVRLGEPDEKNPWPPEFKKGAVVVTRPYGGQEIGINREQYLFLTMEEIVGIVE